MADNDEVWESSEEYSDSDYEGGNYDGEEDQNDSPREADPRVPNKQEDHHQYEDREERHYRGGSGRGGYGRGGRGGGGRDNRRRDRPPRVFSQEEILNEVQYLSEEGPFWLNCYGIGPQVTENDVMNYYKSVPAIQVHRMHPSKDSLDVRFESKSHLIAAINLGAGEFESVPFFIRSSIFSSSNDRL